MSARHALHDVYKEAHSTHIEACPAPRLRIYLDCSAAAAT